MSSSSFHTSRLPLPPPAVRSVSMSSVYGSGSLRRRSSHTHNQDEGQSSRPVSTLQPPPADSKQGDIGKLIETEKTQTGKVRAGEKRGCQSKGVEHLDPFPGSKEGVMAPWHLPLDPPLLVVCKSVRSFPSFSHFTDFDQAARMPVSSAFFFLIRHFHRMCSHRFLLY